MQVLYLDESGNHDMAYIDPGYPIFVLGGIIVDQEYAEGEMTDRLNELKREVFGREDIILHSHEIVNRLGPFQPLADRKRMEFFLEKMNSFLRSTDIIVLACAIMKDDLHKKYGETALDPYAFSLHLIVERFCMHLGFPAGPLVPIVVESRGKTLDRELKSTWDYIRLWGTWKMEPSLIRERVSGLDFKKKSDNVAGLQLADLILPPIARHLIGRQDHEDFRIIQSKFRRKPGTDEYMGWGLKVIRTAEDAGRPRRGRSKRAKKG